MIHSVKNEPFALHSQKVDQWPVHLEDTWHLGRVSVVDRLVNLSLNPYTMHFPWFFPDRLWISDRPSTKASHARANEDMSRRFSNILCWLAYTHDPKPLRKYWPQLSKYLKGIFSLKLKTEHNPSLKTFTLLFLFTLHTVKYYCELRVQCQAHMVNFEAMQAQALPLALSTMWCILI